MDPNIPICQRSNTSRLPPLQFAIYQKNHRAIENLLKAGFSLTCQDKDGKLILSEHDTLPLYLIYINSGGIKQDFLRPKPRKKSFYTGFLMERESSIQWVVAKLPKLTKTIILECSVKVYPLDVKSIATALESIVKCSCPQPLLVAFKQKLIEPNAILSNGMHLSQYISTHGTKEITKQYLGQYSETLYQGIGDQNSMIESAIDNPDVLKVLLEILSEKENIIPSEKSKIRDCLSNSLRLSVMSNDIKALNHLLDHVDRVNDTYPSECETLIQITLVQGEKPEFIEAILNKISTLTNQDHTHIKDKSDVLISFIDWKNNASHTALHISVLKDRKQSLAILLKSSKISIPDNEGNSALHIAIKMRNFTMVECIVQRILEVDCEILNQPNELGCTPLHLAVEKEYEKITLFLLEKGAVYNLTDNNGCTILHYAVQIRDVDARKLLINCILNHEKKVPTSKPLTRECEKIDGYTPLHLATVLQYYNAVDLLLSTDHECLKMQDKNGQTTLHIAVTPKLNVCEYSLCLEQPNQAIFIKILETIIEQEKILSDSDKIEERLSSSRDNEGKTVLHLCLKFQNIDALFKLLETNPCLNITDNAGNTLIHEAVLTQSDTGKECLELLIKNIENIQPEEKRKDYFYALNGNGLTPLHSAIQENNKLAVECLIHHDIQLAFENANSLITLLDDGKDFSLDFLTKNGEFYVGYAITFLQVDYWVASQMPRLKTTEIFENNIILHLNDSVEKAIFVIMKCRSFEPLQAAIRKQLIDPEGRIDEKHMSQLVSKNATKEVMEFYIVKHDWALYEFPEEESMIECAISNDDNGTLELLLQKLPVVDRQELPPENNSIPTKQQLISLCLYKSIKKSIFNDGTEAMELLLKYNARINYTYGPAKDTLLHLIVENRVQNSFAKLILDKLKDTHEDHLKGFDDIPFIDAKNVNGKTALHLSIESSQYTTFKTLLEYLPDLLIQDDNGDTALHHAVKVTNRLFVKDIIELSKKSCAVLEAKNNDGSTALHSSIDVAELSIVECLLENGSNFYSTDHDQQTLLHHAVLLSNTQFRKAMVDFISQYENSTLQKCEIAQMQDYRKNCPLQLAVDLQLSDIIESLLLIDSGVLILRDKSLRSVLHLAILAREKSENHKIQESIFDTILNAILSHEKTDVGQCLESKIIDYQDYLGKTVLHYCLQLNDVNSLTKLLAASPDFGLKDLEGNTALHQAVVNCKYADCLYPLLDAMKDEHNNYFYSLNNRHLPPLQFAILNNNHPSIEILGRYHFQLAFLNPNSDGITLCDEIEDFSLKFIYQASTCFYYTGYEFNFNEIKYWVVSQLPELKVTWIFENSEDLIEPNISTEPALLKIMKCRSQEPLKAAFRNKLLFPNQQLDANTFLSQFAGRHATKEVMEFYLQVYRVTLFNFGENNLSIIESAISNPELATLDLLLKALKKVDSTQEVIKTYILACLHNSLELSVENDSSNALSLLLEYNSVPNDLYSSLRNTLLHQIILKNKKPEFISCLLDKISALETELPDSTKINNDNFIDVKNVNSKTAMHLSIEYQQKSNLEMLLKYGPRLDVHDQNKNTALHLAVCIQKLEFVQMIVNEIIRTHNRIEMMNSKNRQGCTPLHLAVYFGNVEITEYLLQNGSEFQVVDDCEQTILHYAVSVPSFSFDYPHIAEFILKKYPSLLKATDKWKRTPLHLAVIQHNHNNFDSLLQALNEIEMESSFDNHIISYQDHQGKTALHLSIEHQNFHALDRLLEMNPCLHLEDKDKNTILHYATMQPNDGYSIHQVLLSIKTRFKDQFETYIYHTNNLELTPLQLAIKHCHMKAIGVLVVEFGVSIVHIDQNMIKLNSTSELPLRFYVSTSDCNQYYIGYPVKEIKFVVCRIALCMDNLSETEILQEVEIEEDLNEDLLIQIMLSQTSEPLEAYLRIINLTVSLSKSSTLIHFAAQYGTHQVVCFLISKFDLLPTFKYEKQDEEGNSILHRAIGNEDFKSVKLLLKRVRDYEKLPPTDRIINIKNEKGYSALDVALEKERIDVFLKYISIKNNATLNYFDPSQNTLLHHIVVSHKDHTEVCLNALIGNINSRENQKERSTLINGIPFIDCYSQDKCTALHLSILYENIVALKILSEKDAQLSLLTVDDEHSIVHLAALCLKDEEYLKTVLDAILSADKPEYYQLLNQKNKDGNCPLHLATADAESEYVEELLKQTDKPAYKTEEYTKVRNEQLYVRDQKGYTPLHTATLLKTKEAIKIIKILFETETNLNIKGRKILNQRCNEGRTPLHLAISDGSPIKIEQVGTAIEILDLIFELADEVDPELEYLLCIDHDLRSILHYAVEGNNFQIFECVIQKLTNELPRLGQLLLNLQNKSGKTALIMAIEKENFEIFKKFLKLNPSLHCRDDVNQWTVLHHAIDKYSESTTFFDEIWEGLKNQEEFKSLSLTLVNIMDKNYHTTLHLAMKKGNEHIVELLINTGAKIAVEKEYGSDTYTVGVSGDNPLDVMFGRGGHETDLQIYVYLVAYKIGSEYLVSNLPNFDDTKFCDSDAFKKDVELHTKFIGDLEPLVRKVVASKCPELVEKMLLKHEAEDKMITKEFAPETKLIYIAAQNGSKAVMRYVCEKVEPKFDYESQDNFGNTLIHYAANNTIPNIKTLKYVLKRSEEFEKVKKDNSAQKIINFTNNKNRSALEISINSRKYEFFIALINRGANLTEQNDKGNSILHVLMLEKGSSKTLKFEGIKIVIESILKNEKLKKKLNTLLSIKNHNDCTVLQIAIMECQNEIVKFLIKNKANVKDIQSLNRNTILHMATLNEWDESDMECISVVFNAVKQQDKDKTTLRVRNIDLETPLHISVRDKEKNFMIKSLLDVGVPLGIYNRERNTALHVAAINEDHNTLELIMRHLIKKAKEHQLADRRLEYMRELVRENKNKLMPISIPKKKKNLKTMLRAWNHYHEVNMGDGRRGLLIHFAVYNEKTELVEGILESIKEIEERHEVDNQNLLSSRDTDDLTPLHVAAEVGNEEIVDLLIQYGADIQLNSARGAPVEIAMQKDHIHLALKFVKAGAKINKYLDLLTYDKIDDRDIQEIFDKKKINVERRISSADCTVIHYAAKQSSVSRIALLLRNNIALTTTDRDGKRVLHYAVQYRDDYDVLKFFLDEASKRDEAIERKLEKESEESRLKYEELNLSFMEALFYHDLDGINPVMLAASLDKIQLFRLLTTSKYEYLLDSLDACDPDENNVMHYLAKHRSIKTARYIVPRIYKYDVYLFTRIMNDRNVRGESPIDLARKRGLQEMVDLFIEHCDCEYFEACPDVVHRMVRGKDFHNFEKVLDKTVIQGTQKIQIATKLMDSNEEGAYPNYAYFNFHLDALWHKLYKSNEIKFKYHPMVKFLIEEKSNIYKWWFLMMFLLYLFSFYIPLVIALSLASSRCDNELFLYNTLGDYARLTFEMYILIFTWVYMMNEVIEIFGKYLYFESLDNTTNDLRYHRGLQVQYYGDEESNKFTKLIQNIVKQLFYEIPIKLKMYWYRWERSDHFFIPRFLPRAIYHHYSDTYNMIDLSGVFLLLFLFFFRFLLYFSKSAVVVELHWAIQALTFTVFTLKFFKYTKMIPSLGIYIETLSNVLSRDVPRFTLVVLIVLVGYTGSIQQVARTYISSQCDKGTCSFSGWFNDDSIPFSPITTPLISGILFTIDGGPSNYEGSLRDVSFLFSVLYLIFAFSIIVILLNVFIAQLSQTYSDINSTKDLWDFKADLALEFETQSNILFVFTQQNPLKRALKRIMVQSIIIPVDVWKECWDSYLKKVSDSTSGDESKHLQTEQEDSNIEKQLSIQDIQNTIDKILDKKILKHDVGTETSEPSEDKNKQGQNEDLKSMKKKIEHIEEMLSDFVKGQNKSQPKSDTPQGVNK